MSKQLWSSESVTAMGFMMARSSLDNDVQTLFIAGKTFVVLEETEYQRLRELEQSRGESSLPELPDADDAATGPPWSM